MADEENRRKRGLEAADKSDDEEEDEMIGPMPVLPPKAKKKRGIVKQSKLMSAVKWNR